MEFRYFGVDFGFAFIWLPANWNGKTVPLPNSSVTSNNFSTTMRSFLMSARTSTGPNVINPFPHRARFLWTASPGRLPLFLHLSTAKFVAFTGRRNNGGGVDGVGPEKRRDRYLRSETSNCEPHSHPSGLISGELGSDKARYARCAPGISSDRGQATVFDSRWINCRRWGRRVELGRRKQGCIWRDEMSPSFDWKLLLIYSPETSVRSNSANHDLTTKRRHSARNLCEICIQFILQTTSRTLTRYQGILSESCEPENSILNYIGNHYMLM